MARHRPSGSSIQCAVQSRAPAGNARLDERHADLQVSKTARAGQGTGRRGCARGGGPGAAAGAGAEASGGRSGRALGLWPSSSGYLQLDRRVLGLEEMEAEKARTLPHRRS